MRLPKPQPVLSADNLRQRVERLLLFKERKLPKSQLGFDSMGLAEDKEADLYPRNSVAEFLDFITDAIPTGDVYLFGGVLRDLAILGKRGFNSDIDLVVDGNWSHFVNYLEALDAKKNKFGGYRFNVGHWPIDIWNAEETWAIRQGLVQYKGIVSLTSTTVLNWDAILMNWRTRNFIYRNNYFDEINSRIIDIVLQENPSPLGMVVRVFRHLCLKDARQITVSAAKYLAKLAKTYSYEEVKNAEYKSYKNVVIESQLHEFFREIDTSNIESIQHYFAIARFNAPAQLGLR